MRVIRATVIGLVVGIAVAVMLRSSGRFAPRTTAAPKTAEQVRTEEIFRANENLPADPQLTSEYQAINARYFDNRLPAVRLRWEPRLDEIGPLIANGFRMDGVTDRRVILLNPVLQDNDADFRRVLCHEMVHVAVITEKQPHGPIFQAYLQQLLAKGAFTGIVATDQEKEERRRSLHAEEGKLETEAASLARTKAQLEAEAAVPGASPEEMNARIANYNADVRRHNDGVVAFNRSIEEYNQMVSYPDGLDRERLAARPPVRGS